MLSSIHTSSSSAATVEYPELLARTPGRILAARTLGELRDLLATILAGLYADGTACDLYVVGGGQALAPVRPGGGDLLASLKSRLVTTRHLLERSLTFPALRALRRGPLMSTPLVDAAERPIGLVAVSAEHGAREFTHRDLSVLEGIAALLSLALQRLRGEQRRTPRARSELDREAACRVQRSLLGGRLPPSSGLTAHAEYLPAFDVGGDFYTLKHLGDRKVGVSIGDVSGNGVSAALLMSRVASDIERALVAGKSPAALLGEVNAGLTGRETEMYVTASCILIDVAARTLTVSNAGHLPMIVRRAGGEVFTCGAATGTPLGVLPCDYEEEVLRLEPKDLVLLMTDGLLEALDHPSGHMGMKVLMKLVHEAPHDPGLVHERIRVAVDRARSRHDLDDVTWVALQS